ncbi:hypothetical protein IE077_001363, partial [Cardiosporidium cionae]
MENEESNMRKFGVCLLPLLNIMTQGRESIKALTLLVDIEAALCRLPENATKFANNNGIQITVDLIHANSYDIPLLVLGVYLLGIQSSREESIEKLMEAGKLNI